jgi:hypothetical protein
VVSNPTMHRSFIANHIVGLKSHEQRKAIFKAAVAEGKTSRFKVITIEMEKEGRKILQVCLAQLQQAFQDAFESINADLEGICHKITNDSPEGRQLCADLKALVEPARKRMNGRVYELLQECDALGSEMLTKAQPIDPVKMESVA